MTLLKVNNLSKEYKSGVKALDNVSFSVEEGDFITIIGPSGAGKSTLLRCINRMIDPSKGEISFNNTEVTKIKKRNLRYLRRSIGMIFQHYNLVHRLSVVENVLHGRLGYKSTLEGIVGKNTEEEKKQAFEILAKLGLTEHAYKRCDELSGGQKQRVGIARALIQHPKLVLCDEPIASLDPNASKIIMDHLRKINKEMGITCILNLHQVDVALKYSDKVIGINGGKVVYNGKPEDLSREKIYEIYGTEAGELITD